MLAALVGVADPRARRGRRHQLLSVLGSRCARCWRARGRSWRSQSGALTCLRRSATRSESDRSARVSPRSWRVLARVDLDELDTAACRDESAIHEARSGRLDQGWLSMRWCRARTALPPTAVPSTRADRSVRLAASRCAESVRFDMGPPPQPVLVIYPRTRRHTACADRWPPRPPFCPGGRQRVVVAGRPRSQRALARPPRESPVAAARRVSVSAAIRAGTPSVTR